MLSIFLFSETGAHIICGECAPHGVGEYLYYSSSSLLVSYDCNDSNFAPFQGRFSKSSYPAVRFVDSECINSDYPTVSWFGTRSMLIRAFTVCVYVCVCVCACVRVVCVTHTVGCIYVSDEHCQYLIFT